MYFVFLASYLEGGKKKLITCHSDWKHPEPMCDHEKNSHYSAIVLVSASIYVYANV